MTTIEKDLLLTRHNKNLYGIEIFSLSQLLEKIKTNPQYAIDNETIINKCIHLISKEIDDLLSIYLYVDSYYDLYAELIDQNESDLTSVIQKVAESFRLPETYSKLGSISSEWTKGDREKILFDKWKTLSNDQIRSILWHMYHSTSDSLHALRSSLMQTTGTMFKALKNEIRLVYQNQKEWKTTDLVQIFSDHLSRSEIAIEKTLKDISQFKNDSLENGPKPYVVAKLLRELGGNVILKVRTTKLSSAGHTDDDGLLRDISKVGGVINGASESGTVTLFYEKSLQHVNHENISAMTTTINDVMEDFFSSCDRLKGTLDIRSNHLRFINAIINVFVALLQTKHITQYNCAKNYIREKVTALVATDAMRGIERKKLIKHLNFNISMSLEFLFSLSPTTIDNWINTNFHIIDKEKRSERFLFSTVGDGNNYDPSSFKTMKIFTDDILLNPDYLKSHSYLMRTSLANLVYVLTHTSTSETPTNECVEVYKLVERADFDNLSLVSQPGASKPQIKSVLALKKIAVFFHDKFILTKYYSARFLNYLLKLDRHQQNSKLDNEGNVIYKLKPSPTRFFSDTKELPYLESRIVFEDRILTNLEVCIEFIVNLLLNTEDNNVYDASVKDIYIQTKVGINNNNITIQPHSPYKNLNNKKVSSITLLEEHDDNNNNSNSIIGINDFEYTIKPDFIINDEFTISTQAPFYMMSINRSFTRYIDETMVDNIVNYWFTKRLFERVETLRLEDNPETINLTEAISPIEGKRELLSKFRHLSHEFTTHKLLVNKPVSEILKKHAMYLNMKHESMKRPPTMKRQFNFPLKDIDQAQKNKGMLERRRI